MFLSSPILVCRETNVMSRKIVGYQSWRSLLFIHWRIAPDHLQALLPAGLTVETFDQSAWLALVPFSMQRVRPWWSPPVPGISWFLETNVRTYVRLQNGQTGVWFFSLDADHRLAVAVARKFWHLNYQFSSMRFQETDGRVRYSGKRSSVPQFGYEIEADVDSSMGPNTAAPESLEHFLFERYHLIAQRPDGRFLCGEVQHAPYPWRPAIVNQMSQTLTDAMGCPLPDQAADHVAFSPGVDVCVSSLTAV